jgi:hypothetical protein
VRQFSWRWWHDGDDPDIAGWEEVSLSCEQRAGRLCRYAEICPKGPGHPPNGGTQKETAVAFSPYARADGKHDYVFVGLNGTCESLLDSHGADEVAHVKSFVQQPASVVKEDYLCCSGDEPHTTYPFLRWLHTSQETRFTHFSWQQVDDHCRSPPAEFPTLGYATRLCTYSEICPWGESHPPQGSYPKDGSLWAPYRRTDGVNGGIDYASAGTGNVVFGPCASLCDKMGCSNATLLSEAAHEMKQYIACCA